MCFRQLGHDFFVYTWNILVSCMKSMVYLDGLLYYDILYIQTLL